VFVQEGITDSVAGFLRSGGQGKEAKYDFLQLNHLRLQSWQNWYNSLDNQNIFRLQDLINCAHYGDVRRVCYERLEEIGYKSKRGLPNRFVAQQIAMGIYYATACQTSYFFHYYKEGGSYVYREKWWKFLKEDYTGELVLESHNNLKPAIDAFKKTFGINSDKDWETINEKFVKYTLNLTPENVGKGADSGEIPTGEPEKPGESDGQDTINPEARQLPEGAQQSANRREDEALVP
jgi:hypothetical protein